MSGVKLPDYTSLGQGYAAPAPQVNDRVATYANADAPGLAQEQLGKVEQEAGSNLNSLVNVADVNNTMANNFQPKINDLASNFYSLSGKAAMDAAPDFTKNVQQAMNDAAGNLDGEARTMFMKQAQPIVDQHDYKAAMHAGDQARVYAAQSNDAMLQNHLSEYQQSVLTDAPAAADSKSLGTQQLGLYMQSTGIQPGTEIYKEKMNAYTKQFDDAAQAAAQKNILAQSPANQLEITKKLNAAASTGNSAAANAAPAKDIASAILGQESGNNSNAPTSVDGAVGKEQITPGTFDQYAKPGESIVNNADRANVFNRMMSDYSARYNGDAQRIAVAYFSGPGNVAPANSSTPWINDVKDGNGKSVSSYVSDINNRLGTPSDNASPAPPNQTGGTANYMGVTLTQPVIAKLTEAAISNKEHADKLQKLGDETNFNQTQNDFFTKQHNNQLTWQDIQTANLPVQGPGGKDWWQERLNKTEKTDPAVFNDLMQRALLPDGTAGKLTDPKELLGNVGHGITYSDMQHLQGVMDGGETGKDSLKQFWKQGHDQLSKSTMTDIDGEGERRAYNWYMATSKQIADGEKKGLGIQDMIDPTSKNYVGNNISQYQEDLTTQSNNLAQKMRLNQPAAALPPEKVRKNGESPEDYIKRMGL